MSEHERTKKVYTLPSKSLNCFGDKKERELLGYFSGLIGEEGEKNNTSMPIVQTARQD
jgi:hypothetical protein